MSRFGNKCNVTTCTELHDNIEHRFTKLKYCLACAHKINHTCRMDEKESFGLPFDKNDITKTLKEKMKYELLIEIEAGPKCPSCGLDTFDDYWLSKTIKRGYAPVELYGSIKCHGCGKFFSITKYSNGTCHSTMKKKITD